MILLIDCGNTRIKWRLSEGDKIYDQGWVNLSDLVVSDLLLRLNREKVDQALISTVSLSPKLDVLAAGLSKKIGDRVKFLTHRDLGACDFAYKDVEKLGIDRCLVIQAVRAMSDGGGLVIDAGSAMTADFVSPGGEHMGGYIFPGCKMLQDSLIEGTSKIAMDKEVEHGLEPGRNTESCVANAVGVMVSQSLKFMQELCAQYGIKNIYVAGGDAVYVAGYIDGSCDVRQDLVFEGMLRVAKKMVKGECGL